MTEAQKRAQRKYYETKRSKTQKTISITQSAEQTAADKATLTAHGLTPLRFWRAAMERLNAEPIPASSEPVADN